MGQALKPLKLPQDSNSEIYFNSNNLTVDFRKRETTKPLFNRMLRVVVQAYGQIIEDKFFTPGTKITFGVGKKNVFPFGLPNLPNRYPLITYLEGGRVNLQIDDQFSGILQMGDKLVSLNEAKKGKGTHYIELISNPRGALEIGTFRIYFEEINDPEKVVPLPFIQSIADKEFGRWLIVSLALHLMLLILIKVLPSPPEEKELTELPKEFQKILIQPQKVKPYEPVIMTNALNAKKSKNANPSMTQPKVSGGGREGEGARAPGAEGKRGGAKKPVARPSIEKVKNAGVLSFFAKGGKSGGFNDLVDGSVTDLADTLARPSGDRSGMESDAEKRVGKGVVGSGTGGGGNTASLGRGLGTKGKGGGAKGDGLADFGTGKSRSDVRAAIDGEPTVIGSLSKDQIARVINSYMGQIRYCYERELQVDPNLRGKILVRFVIGVSGSVTSAETQSSSMGSPKVEGCINGVFRRMPFPSPGASIVEAVYPLVFNIAG